MAGADAPLDDPTAGADTPLDDPMAGADTPPASAGISPSSSEDRSGRTSGGDPLVSTRRKASLVLARVSTSASACK
eukprot:1936374-Pyramimonas_sp.AAC.1